MMKLRLFGKLALQQECIPVGCVPAARRPYARICFRGGLLPGGSALGGVPGPGGVCSQGGVCVSAPRGVVVSQHALRQNPPPCEQNDKQV